ncbi:hypothetical protein CBOM_00764 [Ceraceosorus bombacis]|uniref:Uncharacterized protein n=1 Tax=Ceraceosorus bombacis TaxID=401625 RepID=A0A0P1B9Y6_9BASI|nr:hypothetical protein CBOM_00764 [Ceraceosorus bombacis]
MADYADSPQSNPAGTATTTPLTSSELERLVSEKLAPYQASLQKVEQLAAAMDVTNADILDLPAAPADKELLLVKMHREQYQSICNTLDSMEKMREATERMEERVGLLEDSLAKTNSKRKADGDEPEGKRARATDSWSGPKMKLAGCPCPTPRRSSS